MIHETMKEETGYQFHDLFGGAHLYFGEVKRAPNGGKFATRSLYVSEDWQDESKLGIEVTRENPTRGGTSGGTVMFRGEGMTLQEVVAVVKKYVTKYGEITGNAYDEVNS